jgi:fructose-1-phosphate kinase PfkB-like protein
MILCVTLNPCLDKTLTVRPWRPGAMIRGLAVREVVGGKGNNVARALARLGRSGVRPVTFLGGMLGERCERLLRELDGFDPLITPTEAPTREILTVRTGDTAEQTSFFDPNPAIRPDEAAALLNRVEGALIAEGVEAVTLSGSSPSEATHELYSDIVGLALARKVPVFLDTYGPALEAIWGFWPTAMQVNRKEAGLHLRTERPTDEAVRGMLDDWAGHGVSCGIVTDGAAPILARLGDQHYRIHPPEIEVVNPVG